MHNKTILPRGATDAAVVRTPLRQLTGSVELFLMGGGLQPARPRREKQTMMTTAATADRGGSSAVRIRTDGITRSLFVAATRDISG